MNCDKLHGKALFVFSDPAGAKAVLAQAYFLQKQNLLADFRIISDRKYNFYEDFSLEVLPYKEGDELLLKSFRPDFIFAGTSYTSKIELKFIKQAQSQDIFTIAFIDHWTNFRSRFVWNDEVIYPDEIWVIDEEAKKLALEEGLDAKKIQVRGNPYYNFLRNWKPTIQKGAFLENLGLPKSASYILYVPEPLSQVGGIEKYGFDEFEILEQIVSELSGQYLLDLKNFLLIKLHPNQNKNIFTQRLRQISSSCLQIKVLEDANINLLMFYADSVIGLFSNALLEGKLIGANVVRLMPKRCKIDPLRNQLTTKERIFS